MNSITVPVLTSSIISTKQSLDFTESKMTTGESTFNDVEYSLEDYNGLFITDRMDALNFRHRVSHPGYASDWHVAGDPTLIIVRAGTLRIGLRSGEYRDFSAGDMFIAKDFLQPNETFDENVHGHNAQLIGDDILLAVHIKLGTLNH